MNSGIRHDKTAGVLISLGLYVVALAVAIAAVRLFAPDSLLLVVGVGSVVAATTIFVASVLANNSSMFDPYWSVAPAVVTGYYVWLRLPDVGAREALVAETGLWRHSRHPNYLGEVATWWGLYLFALADGMEWWWTGIGASAITLMFVFISVPMMERRALATREAYADYSRRTPMLLPLRLRR